jgi:cytochrome c oxidase subunit 2
MFDNFPLWPTGASSHALGVDLLYSFLVVLSFVTTLLIFVVIAIFGMKYRRRHGREAQQIHGSLILEIVWSVIPLGIFFVIFAWGAVIYFEMRTPPRDAAEIYVVGKQWMWKIQHVEGQREINELHIPVDRNVKLIMTSQDVIHSFFVPEFRVKQDVVPGRYTTLWFKATKPGTYHLFCTQYCGTQHSGMIGDVVVMNPTDYQMWMSGGTVTGSLAQNGQTVVTPEQKVSAQEQKSNFVTLRKSGTVDELIRALNALGVTPRDTIAILEALKAAGALQAELEII